jgi:hypothetical protein
VYHCSQSALNSWWVEEELETAFKKERSMRKKRGEKVLVVIPLNLDGYIFDWEGGHSAELTARLAPDFTGWETNNTIFEKQIERVVLALRADHGVREK